jgi:hypothetical protein
MCLLFIHVFIATTTKIHQSTTHAVHKLNYTYLLTYGAESFLRSCQLCSHSRTSQHFTEPESSLPCSQVPSIGPYPEPDRSSPHHPILSLRSILILSTYLRFGFTSGLFPSSFPTNILYPVLLYPHSCYMPRPSDPPWLDHSNYIWRGVQVMKLLNMQFSPISSLFSLRTK